MGYSVTSYTIKSDISEKQMEADIASYLGWCSVGLPFKLLDVDEQITGADKRLDTAIPVYLQFKKSSGLASLAVKPMPKRKNASKLQRVRRFRKERGLEDDPSLYFQLRKKAKTASDFQHNVLLCHNIPGISYAVYVAPTLLSRSEYIDELTKGPRFADHLGVAAMATTS